MKVLTGLSIDDYQHELDKASFLNLKKYKAFDKAVDWVVKNTVEEVINVQQTGSNICVSEKMINSLNHLVSDISRIVDVNIIPQVYSRWGYNIYITTDGDKHPKMIFNTGTIDLLSKEELVFLIGHEFGHIKSEHLKYLLLCRYWFVFSPIIPGSTLLQIPLFYWSRMTDLTADRLGLLACQDLNSALTVMIKMAGAPISYYDRLDVKAFIEQARNFDDYNKQFVNSTIEKLSIMDNRMPWLVKRASELLKWYESGEYSKVLQKYGI